MNICAISRAVLRKKLCFGRVASQRIAKFSDEPVKDESSIISYSKTNMPDHEMSNPYVKERRQCILCKLRIDPDYKNVRLLSQFVSHFTGKVYGRHITGLCRTKQDKLEMEIRKSQNAGYMPTYFRYPHFAHDPKLFDPDNPFRPHKY